MKTGKALLAAAIIVGLLAGCGGDDSDSASSKPATTNTTEAPITSETDVVPADIETGLVTHYKALTEAGFDVTAEEVGSNTLGGLKVEPAGVEVDHYATPADAAQADIDFGDIRAENPDRIMYRQIGDYLYWIAAERALTAAEKAAFKKVVRIGRTQ